LVDVKNTFLLCHVRGPEGLIVELAERLHGAPRYVVNAPTPTTYSDPSISGVARGITSSRMRLLCCCS
jgi:hypothetical protein